MGNWEKSSSWALSPMSRRGFAALAAVGAVNTLLLTKPQGAYADAGSDPDSQINTSANTVPFVDSLGRVVLVPANVNAVTPLGVQAQTLMEILCGESLVSLALNMNADAADYRAAGLGEMLVLPRTDAGSSAAVLEDLSEMSAGVSSTTPSPVNADTAIGTPDSVSDVETVVSAVLPDVILDVGLVREGLAASLDSLQEITGVPCVFLDIAFGRLPQAFRMLGDLLSSADTERAESLASYVESVQVLTAVSSEAAAERGSCSVFYAQRVGGLEVRSGSAVQLGAIAHIGATPYTAAYDYSSKTVSVEAVTSEAVDLVVFDDAQCFDSLLCASGEPYDVWRASSAVSEGAIALSPALMHSWFGSPIFVQSIGLLWLSQVIWPEYCARDLVEDARSFYRLFYHTEKQDSEWGRLLGFDGLREGAYEEGGEDE